MTIAPTSSSAPQTSPPASGARRLARIRGLSRWMRGLLVVAAVILVAALVGMWFFTPEAVLARGLYSFLGVTAPAYTEPAAPVALPRLHLGPAYRVLGFVLFGVVAALALRAIAHAHAMFSDFSRGDVLTVTSARHLRGIALLVTVFSVAVPALKTVLMLALTLANGPGGRYMMVGIDVSDILLGLLGGLLFTLAWAMEEAAQVAEENRGFI